MMPRPLTTADLDAIDSLRPADWPPYRATFERYFTLPCCSPFGIETDGWLAAMGTLIHFGPSAWVAQLITHPEAQGRGLGTAMLGFLLAEVSRRSVKTVSLVATDQGFPLYAKAGFRVEGEYSVWTRSEPAPVRANGLPWLRPWSAEAQDQVWALDHAVSGEDRRGYLVGRTDGGWVAGPPGLVDGYFLPGIGEGLVAARTPEAGLAVFGKRLDGATRVVAPLENPWVPVPLTERGFIESKRIRRMVLGPPLRRDPAALWSRIGGNRG